jgi:hypothetical protein
MIGWREETFRFGVGDEVAECSDLEVAARAEGQRRSPQPS